MTSDTAVVVVGPIPGEDAEEVAELLEEKGVKGKHVEVVGDGSE
jgi:hypothetical protein